MSRLTDFKALTFDCYGTLIDWECGIWNAFQPLLQANGDPAITQENSLKAFAEIEAELEQCSPGLLYPDLLSRVHAKFALKFDLESTSELDSRFGMSIEYWPVFPDTIEALRYFKMRYKLFVLSNEDRKSFDRSNRKLGVTFDGVYTAEEIGTYKPTLNNFEYMLSRLKLNHELEHYDVLHVAQSVFHDHVPAKAIGLSTVWIDRYRLSEKGDWGATSRVQRFPKMDFTFFSLKEMVTALQAMSA